MYKYNRNFFEIIDNEEKAYWLGFIAADGNIRKDFLKLRIELNIKDKEHLEKFRSSIKGDMPIREWIREKNRSCYIEINSKKICQDLFKYGITPNKSLTLEILFEKIPFELQHHLIRGYFDGDGSLNMYEKEGYEYWEISFIGTKHFLNYIMNFFNKKHKISTCGNNFRFNFKKGTDIKDILDILFKNYTITLNRKEEKYNKFLALNDYQGVSLLRDNGIVYSDH